MLPDKLLISRLWKLPIAAASLVVGLGASQIHANQPGLGGDASQNGDTRDVEIEYIVGTAEMVTRDAVIMLRLEDKPDAPLVRLRLWALQAEPKAINFTVLDRKLACLVVYKNSDHIAGDCTIYPANARMRRECGFDNYVSCGAFTAFEALVLSGRGKSGCGRREYDNMVVTRNLGEPTSRSVWCKTHGGEN